MKLTFQNDTHWSTTDLRSMVLVAMKAHGLKTLKVVARYRRKGTGRLGAAYVGGRREVSDGEVVERCSPAHTMWLCLEKDAITRKRTTCKSCNGGGRIIVDGHWHSQFSGWCIQCRGEGGFLEVTGDLSPIDYAKNVASTIDHECYHLRGLHHRNFPKHVLKRGHQAPWFEEGMVLRWAPPVTKLRPSLDEKREEKLAHMQSMHTKSLTRLKRAQTIEKKWRVRMHTAEKRMQLAARKGGES